MSRRGRDHRLKGEAMILSQLQSLSPSRAHGQAAEEALLQITDDKLKQEYCYISWLTRCRQRVVAYLRARTIIDTPVLLNHAVFPVQSISGAGSLASEVSVQLRSCLVSFAGGF